MEGWVVFLAIMGLGVIVAILQSIPEWIKSAQENARHRKRQEEHELRQKQYCAEKQKRDSETPLNKPFKDETLKRDSSLIWQQLEKSNQEKLAAEKQRLADEAARKQKEQQAKTEQERREEELTRKRQQELEQKKRTELENKLREQERVQQSLCESGTHYCTVLNALYNAAPENFSFITIRAQAASTGVYNELQKGVAILNTDAQLQEYLFAYGKMHHAKLKQAFDAVSQSEKALPGNVFFKNTRLRIIDYGCGQGIGTVCLIDHIKQQTDRSCSIDSVKLIEPSILALKRAALHVRLSLQSYNQPSNVVAVNKALDELLHEDFHFSNSSTTVPITMHILSNILDVQTFNLSEFLRKISNSLRGINLFVCVSPNIDPIRNQRLNQFQSHFQKLGDTKVAVISNRETDIPNPSLNGKPWKRIERVFATASASLLDAHKKHALPMPAIETIGKPDSSYDDLPF